MCKVTVIEGKNIEIVINRLRNPGGPVKNSSNLAGNG